MMFPATKAHWFAIAWRAALILLPWQARLILVTPHLNGFPWEQGTVALYASWIPLIATILLGWKELQRRAARTTLRAAVAIPFLVLMLASAFTAAWLASVLWWIHAVLLGLFIATLLAAHLRARQVATWLIFSLIPHTALALAQFGAQHVWGSTALGVSEQIAWQSGVSVVEYGEYRLLRAYGGLPHPNILGGWLTVALLLFPELIRQAKTAIIKFAWIGLGALFCYTLVLTFSRGAWIAAAFGLVFAVSNAFRRAENQPQREAIISGLVIFIAAITIAVSTQWGAIATRTFDPERLEVWSVVQRTNAIHEGFIALQQHPLLGWGPGAALIGIGVARTSAAPIPLEPPHIVPFVTLLDVGILGLAAIIALLWCFLRPSFTKRKWESALPLLATLAILGMTDHYLWTLWGGKCLFIIILFFLWMKRNEA